MKRILIYDWPTRVFHLAFSLLSVAAFVIAKIIDDESPYFPYHMLLGLIIAFAVLLRLIWGMIGSRYARFSSFILSPSALFIYMKSLFSSTKKKYTGHNPASSWASIIMIFLSLGLAITGIMMSQKIYKEIVEEIHELFSTLFIVTALAHVAGILLHTLTQKDPIGRSMFDGRKNIENSQGLEIKNSHKIVGLIFILFLGTFSFYINSGYDAQSGTLTLFQKKFQLGEGEQVKSAEKEDQEDEEDDED